jgi:molybdopterin molybdotransferase
LLEEQDGAWLPLAVGELSLATIARAQAWLLVPGASEGYALGTPVDAYMLGE